MRYLKIFSSFFQDALSDRGRSFVWFLLSLSVPLIMVLFWRGAFSSDTQQIEGWTYHDMATYYVLLAFFGSIIVAHIEEDIAHYDIKKGALVQYLLKPFPYLIFKFYHETPYRIIQGFFAIIALGIFFLLFPKVFSITTDIETLIFAIIIALLGYFISYMFKVVIGLLAFWFVNIGMVFSVIEIIGIIFSGGIIPLILMPEWMGRISYALPFAYNAYFPAAAFLGKIEKPALFIVVGTEIIMLLILYLIYKFIFAKGIRKFTAVGQ